MSVITDCDRQSLTAGTYPTSSKGTDGLAVWTQANRPIENTDLVAWYTLGFHHMPRVEDWPVMPTMWRRFQIHPFNFFAANPALDLPKDAIGHAPSGVAQEPIPTASSTAAGAQMGSAKL
jgi:Cu2+-containing amine oxidase